SAPHEGILEVIGREVRPGEKVPADRLVEVRVAGQVKKYCRLAEGDRVKKGELLARLNDALARRDLEIKQTIVGAREADLVASSKTKEQAHTRSQTMVNTLQRPPGSISQEEVRAGKLTWERYVQEEKAMTHKVNAARLEVEQAQAILEMHEIRSPADGVIE